MQLWLTGDLHVQKLNTSSCSEVMRPTLFAALSIKLFIKLAIFKLLMCTEHEAVLNSWILNTETIYKDHTPRSSYFTIVPTFSSSTAFLRKYLSWSSLRQFQRALKTHFRELLFVCRPYCLRNVAACNASHKTLRLFHRRNNTGKKKKKFQHFRIQFQDSGGCTLSQWGYVNKILKHRHKVAAAGHRKCSWRPKSKCGKQEKKRKAPLNTKRSAMMADRRDTKNSTKWDNRWYSVK